MSEETVMSGGEGATTENTTMADTSWRDSLPEDFREKYTEFKTPEDFVKGYDGLVKKMGANPLVAPKDDAPEEEKQAYKEKLYEQLGLTGSEEDYKIEFTEEIPEKYRDAFTEESFKPYQEIAMKHRISPEAFEEMTNLYIQQTIEGGDQLDGFITQGVEQATETLKQEWGDKFDTKLNAAKELASALVPEFLENPQYGNDPNIIKAFATIRENMTLGEEGKIREQVSTPSDPIAIKERANELNLRSMDDKLHIDDRRAAAQEARKLYQRLSQVKG